jgi:hypothetical protein
LVATVTLRLGFVATLADDWRNHFGTVLVAVAVGAPTGALLAKAFWTWVLS